MGCQLFNYVFILKSAFESRFQSCTFQYKICLTSKLYHFEEIAWIEFQIFQIDGYGNMIRSSTNRKSPKSSLHFSLRSPTFPPSFLLLLLYYYCYLNTSISPSRDWKLERRASRQRGKFVVGYAIVSFWHNYLNLLSLAKGFEMESWNVVALLQKKFTTAHNNYKVLYYSELEVKINEF